MEGKLVAVIGDEDTVTGFVLAGVGQRNVVGCNFLVVNSETAVSEVEEAFTTLTTREDIGILLINQHVADMIRPQLNERPTLRAGCRSSTLQDPQASLQRSA